ncbi:MAG: hypothetical protein R3C53_18850 [Pirellulaceae bacterium]
MDHDAPHTTFLRQVESPLPCSADSSDLLASLLALRAGLVSSDALQTAFDRYATGDCLLLDALSSHLNDNQRAELTSQAAALIAVRNPQTVVIHPPQNAALNASLEEIHFLEDEEPETQFGRPGSELLSHVYYFDDSIRSFTCGWLGLPSTVLLCVMATVGTWALINFNPLGTTQLQEYGIASSSSAVAAQSTEDLDVTNSQSETQSSEVPETGVAITESPAMSEEAITDSLFAEQTPEELEISPQANAVESRETSSHAAIADIADELLTNEPTLSGTQAVAQSAGQATIGPTVKSTNVVDVAENSENAVASLPDELIDSDSNSGDSNSVLAPALEGTRRGNTESVAASQPANDQADLATLDTPSGIASMPPKLSPERKRPIELPEEKQIFTANVDMRGILSLAKLGDRSSALEMLKSFQTKNISPASKLLLQQMAIGLWLEENTVSSVEQAGLRLAQLEDLESNEISRWLFARWVLKASPVQRKAIYQQLGDQHPDYLTTQWVASLSGDAFDALPKLQSRLDAASEHANDKRGLEQMFLAIANYYSGNRQAALLHLDEFEDGLDNDLERAPLSVEEEWLMESTEKAMRVGASQLRGRLELRNTPVVD